MSITLKAGSRLLSTACTAELMVIKAPTGDVELTIGGSVPATAAADRGEAVGVTEGHDAGSLMGKRYVDAAGTIELLCTKAGPGRACLNGELLDTKEAKPLPSSD